jgi:putative photosynthetic complex assembly protein
LLADRPFPRGVLFGAAALLGVALMAAGFSRVTGIGKTVNPVATPVERIELRFEDRSDGAVAVFAGDATREVGILEPGTNGFIRSVLRGLARERRAHGIGAEPAFELTRWADGRLSLGDPATGRSVELSAFGSSNAGAFVHFLGAGISAR